MATRKSPPRSGVENDARVSKMLSPRKKRAFFTARATLAGSAKRANQRGNAVSQMEKSTPEATVFVTTLGER